MESRVRLLILCLVCLARASKVLPEEIAEFKEESLAHRSIENLSRASAQKTDEADGQTTDKLRDKRALGLLLSGLAQIFGYTVTPIQIASLPNPNITKPVAMSNSSMTGTMGPRTAASRPVNATVPKQQETIRFTGVVNFGNNSDIIGHLQRYEQIFHGRPNNTMITKMMSMRPLPMPKLPAKISVDLRTNMQDKPPLLAPFFVKIPLPIAPELLSTVMPVEDVGLSYSDPSVLFVNESNEEETPVRKEQETIYGNNEDTERYTVEEKDIYDEKDMRKPMIKFNHQLYIEEPTRKKQQEDRYNQLQRERLKEQEERRNHDKDARYEEDEINEKHRNREKEIANRNREYTSKDESVEEKRPYDEDVEDEDSAEKERVPANLSKGSSRQPLREKTEKEETEKEETEDYPNYDDDSNKQLNRQPENFNKYIEVEYNQQLPIGDYFHENNPEVIRDSYGEILNNKKLEDDRLASYITMFKHPYVTNVHDSQKIQYPEDALRGHTKTTVDGYREHLARLQKLREEYALPENKYEEYDINDERDADRDDRESDKIQNDTSGKSKRPKTESLRGKEEVRSAKTPIGSNRNEVLRKDDVKSEKTKSQKEVDFAEYMPLVVPIRYIETNDKMKQETVQQLNRKKLNKSTNNQPSKDPTRAVPTERMTSQVIGFPEKPRQLHEERHRDLHIWPPPFDYVFDNTEPVNTIIPNPQGYVPNYYQHVKNIAENDANNDNVSEQPSGYLVIVGNPVQSYRNPYNIYYVPNEAATSENQVPHLNAEDTHSRDQIYASQQNAQQQFIQIRPNLTEYNLNETTKGPHNYYYQTQEIPPNVLNRYRYIFAERTLQPKELLNARSQVPDTENWSSKIYPLQSQGKTNEQFPPIHAQNVASSNQKLRSKPSERPRYPQRLRKRSQSEDQRENDDKTETSQPAPKNKPFDDPQSAHDFFGFSKDDYNFGSESSDASKVSEENGKTTGESDVFDTPEPVAYHHDDESIMKHTDEPENDTEKAKVKEYRNKVATLRVSEQRQLKPNGPIQYVDYEKREEIQRRNELENKMAEILENLKTRLLVE